MNRRMPAAVRGRGWAPVRTPLLNGLAVAAAMICCTVPGTGRAGPAAEDAVVATVNGEAIRESELQIMTGLMLSNRRAGSRDDLNEVEKDARERLIRAHALAQKASELGLDKDPTFQGAMAYQRAVLLERAYYKEYLRKNPLPEAAVEEEYRRQAVDGKMHEYHLRHILVNQKYRAEQLLAELKKGKDLATLAKLYSSDMVSSAKGGDLGWVNLAYLEDHRFVDAVLALKPKRHTPEPVRSSRGWHVVELAEAPRPLADQPGFGDLPGPAREKLRLRAQQRFVSALEERIYSAADVERESLKTREASTGTLGMAE